MTTAALAVVGALLAAIGGGAGMAAVLRVWFVERPESRRDDVRQLTESNRELRDEMTEIHELLMASEERERQVRRDLFAETVRRETADREIAALRAEIERHKRGSGTG